MSNNTLYLITYDIGSNKTRTKVHRLLSAYGQWVQYSVFECHLNKLQKVNLQHKLQTLIDTDTDNVRFYPLCQACLKRVEITIGEPPEEPTLFLL